jgi:molecular chaperone GrpE (heat shock protein)
MSQTQPDPLAFDPPGEEAPQKWAAAEKACLKFPERFLALAKELNECRRDLKEVRAERDRVSGFLFRNLISLIDNCRQTLTHSSGEGEQPAPEAAALAGVERSVLYLLEQLGVFPVDLHGHTYEDVIVDGQKVEDPFEVQSSTQTGKISEVKVNAVISDLWVRRRNGSVEILRRGLVAC